MESDLLKALHQNEAAKEGRMGSRDTQEETLRLKAKRAWEDAQALAAKDTEIERLKAENQRYERLFTSREQDHKELCERYDQLEAENSILKAQLSTAQMSAIEHQAKYVTMHERHQGLWRENLNLKAQLSASEAKRKVLGAECLAWRTAIGHIVDDGKSQYWRLDHEDYRIPAADATDAASALEAP